MKWPDGAAEVRGKRAWEHGSESWEAVKERKMGREACEPDREKGSNTPLSSCFWNHSPCYTYFDRNRDLAHRVQGFIVRI
jgi:hypothetical protein